MAPEETAALGLVLVPREAQALGAGVQEETKEHTGYRGLSPDPEGGVREVGIDPSPPP